MLPTLYSQVSDAEITRECSLYEILFFVEKKNQVDDEGLENLKEQWIAQWVECVILLSGL